MARNIASVKPLAHSKNRLDPVSMEANKNRNVIADHLFSNQLQDLILSLLQEATFKADTIKMPDFEASGVEIKYKFKDPNPQVTDCQQVKKEKSLLDRLFLFTLKQSISTFFSWIFHSLCHKSCS